MKRKRNITICTIASCIVGLAFFFHPYGFQMIGLAFFFLAALLCLSNHPKLAASLLAIACVVVLLLEIPVVRAARTDVPEPVDYVILLGAGVNGTTPSLSLLDRLEAAADYMQKNPACQIIVSGGQGPGEDITEAVAMETYLVKQGIAPSRIVKEDQATNTLENLSYSFQLIAGLNAGQSAAPSVAVLSSEYHLYRAKLIAQSLGYSVSTIAAPTSNWLLKINYFLREAPAVIKAWLTI